MGLLRYIWHFVLVLSVLLLVWAGVKGVETWKVQRTIGRAQGKVLRTIGQGTLGLDFLAEIQFTTPDGVSHTFSSMVKDVNALRKARAVSIAYDLDDPAHARVEMRAQNPWESAILLSVWGGVFTLLGGIPLFYNTHKAKQVEWLKLNGRAVQADFAGVHLNTDLVLNDKSPYRIHAHWMDPATNQDYNFYSDNLWTDPTAHIHSRAISVMIDPGNPKRYWMDLSFLPHSSD